MRHYRPDIDGLRAIAVLPVVLFHAHIPGFSGGFVGVDVFFVISGFLITSILIAEMEAGCYSIRRFYERRLRRIMPSLLLVLFFVILASPFFLLPSEFRDLWKELLAALFFSANFYFWSGSGYFSTDAEAKPLLHTWSLGVEEQFYIFAPLLFLAGVRLFRRQLGLVMLLCMGASLAACIFLTPTHTSASFYLLPTRAWELLAGGVLAIYRPKVEASSRGFTMLAWVGLLFIATAVFAYSAETVFPGYAAVLPVMGAALVISFGQGTSVARLLSARPLVFIGLISYSLYLWHWPLTVFFRDSGWLISTSGKIVLVFTSLLFGWLTWKYVEGPTRNKSIVSTPTLIWGSAIGAIVISGVAGVYSQLDGWPSRVSGERLAYDSARYDISPTRDKCYVNAGIRPIEDFCVLGQGDLRVAVWADSHGVELTHALSEQGVQVRGINYSSCPPDVSGIERSHRPHCAQHNRVIFDYLISAKDIDVVVLTMYYKHSLERLSVLGNVANALVASGKRVVVVGPTPALPGFSDLPAYLARGGTPFIPYGDLPSSAFYAVLDSKVELFLPEEVFCASGTCSLLSDGRPILFDGHHPSMSASRTISLELSRCLKERPCSRSRASATMRPEKGQ